MTEDDAPTLQGSLARGPTSRQAAVDEPQVPDEERYELQQTIGRGGMGEIRLAHDVRIDREVAVKLMRPEQRDPETIARFFREARIQGRLDHPAVAPVHDLGIDRQGTPYFVMKRLTGTTLAEVLAGRGKDPVIREKWPRRQLLARFVDLCLAVEFAHTRGIVHRDLKPANVMLGDFGEVYVLDWGLARVLENARRSQPIAPLPGDSGAGQTAVGSVLGTPGYMPPEQIRDPSVDGRADVYALGCILYEILTGQAALPSGIDALDATLGAECHRPSERFPELAVPELDEICATATAADRAARPSAREVGDAVQAYLDGDRDLARRRDLARHHARRAQDAFVAEGDDMRARAMREAGRALVLDANNVDAQGVLAHLLLEAPHQVPEAARAEADLERSITRQAVLRWVWPSYLGITALLAGLLVFPVRHATVVVFGMVMTLGCAATAWVATRQPLPIKSPIFLLLVWMNACSIVCGGVIFGPFLVVPIYLIGAIAAGLTQPIGYRWPHIVGPQLIGFMLPLVLEWSRVLPSSYHFDEGGLVLTPYALDLTHMPSTVLMLIAILSQVAITTAMMVMARTSQTRAQDRLHAQTWHLQQLLPRRTTNRKKRGGSDIGIKD